jgi:hypothetical protein
MKVLFPRTLTVKDPLHGFPAQAPSPVAILIDTGLEHPCARSLTMFTRGLHCVEKPYSTNFALVAI